MNPTTLFPAAVPPPAIYATAHLHQVTSQSTGQVTTTTFPLTPPEPAESAVGGLVFFVVVTVIVAGAVLLYLRNRAPRGPGAGSGPA